MRKISEIESFDSLKQISKEMPDFQQYHKVVEGWKGQAVFKEDLKQLIIDNIKELHEEAIEASEAINKAIDEIKKEKCAGILPKGATDIVWKNRFQVEVLKEIFEISEED